MLDWLYKKCTSIGGLVGGVVSDSNLTETSGYDINPVNLDIHLKHMLDDNELYRILSVFKDKKSFEVLTLVYLRELFVADELYQIICDAKLQPPEPEWLQDHQDITQRIKNKLLKVDKLDNYEFVKHLKNKRQ